MTRRTFLTAALGGPLMAQAGFVPLWNGRNLDDWIVDTPGLWSAGDGEITGVSPGLKYNDFLRTRKHYRDFVLKVTFKMTDASGRGNSGIQFRSRPVEDSHEVAGYQADIGQQYWGCLYDESRRRRVLAQASAESLKGLNKDGWNEYAIEARGNRITLRLNGVQTVDYTETEAGIDSSGFIALQLHGGPPMKMQFKDLLIQELK